VSFVGGVARAALRRGAVGSVLCAVALASFSSPVAAQGGASSASIPTVIRNFPKILAVTIVADEHLLATFQQRVSSWFDDGTEVRITATSEVDLKQLLATSATEVRAWIVPLSAERALLTVSCITAETGPRHLVREVRIRNGFDELGLERLASIVHSAFVALSEGVEGVEREQAERELGEAGVSASSLAPPSTLAVLTPPRAPLPPAATQKADTAPIMRPKDDPASGAALLVATGYGVRWRGAEGLGQGPSVALGVQLRGNSTDFDVLLSGQFLLRSAFAAEPFSASVQTSALRLRAGIEPRLRSSLFGQALVGVGADIARISASAADNPTDAAGRLSPHTNGSQWRSAADLTLGIVRRGESLDVGLYAQATFSFEDVRYSAATSDGETLLVRPWPVQPSLGIQGRFRGAL